MSAHEQRKYAANRQGQCLRDFKHWESELEDYNFMLALSSACQQIALECALSAVTLGAAGAIGRKLASIAIKSESIVVNGRGAKVLATLARRTSTTLTNSPIYAQRIRNARNASMTMGRLCSALLQQPVRWALGQELSMKGLAAGLLTAIGIPGLQKSGLFSWTGSGSCGSWQGANVAFGCLAKGFAQYTKESCSQNREYLALVEGGVKFPLLLERRSCDIAQSTVQYAIDAEGPLARTTEAKVRTQDFSGKVPFLARHFSNASDHVRNFTAKITAASAQHQLWSNVYQSLMVLDRATHAAQQVLPSGSK